MLFHLFRNFVYLDSLDQCNLSPPTQGDRLVCVFIDSDFSVSEKWEFKWLSS